MVINAVEMFQRLISKTFQKTELDFNLLEWPKEFCHPLRPLCAVRKWSVINDWTIYGLRLILGCIIQTSESNKAVEITQPFKRLSYYYLFQLCFGLKCFFFVYFVHYTLGNECYKWGSLEKGCLIYRTFYQIIVMFENSRNFAFGWTQPIFSTMH